MSGKIAVLTPEDDLRVLWKHEAQDFTPWLAENLDRLGQALGVELDSGSALTEFPIEGQLRADIVASTADDESVVIENQLEEADLKHLGQLVSYGADVKAQWLVWVAADFKPVHLQTIRWLNEGLGKTGGFFAVRVCGWRVKEAQHGVHFEVLERPVSTGSQSPDRSRPGKRKKTVERWRKFWAHYVERVKDAPEPLRSGYWSANPRIWVEEANLSITLCLNLQWVRLWLDGKRGEQADEVLQRISPYRNALQAAVDKRAWRYPDWCSAGLDVDTGDEANWDEAVDFLDKQRRIYERVLREVASNLKQSSGA